jgi:hypothetical protein
MMGRAGRGNREGHAVALLRPNDGWQTDELANAIREERLPDLASALQPQVGRRKRTDGPALDPSAIAALVLARLLHHKEQGLTLAEAQTFFSRSLGGRTMASEVGSLLAWLCDPSRCLAYRDHHGRHRATVLGQCAAQTMLPLNLAAGAAQLVRDLLSADEKDQLLSQWQSLDHLILLELLNPRSLPGRRFNEKLAEQVDAWMEGNPTRGSLIYRQWVRGAPGASRAEEVLGSLGIGSRREAGEDGARELAYRAVFRAAVLTERASGQETTDIERRWGVSGLEGIEERWRDETLWLLSGWSRLLEVRCFYYHLREVCSANVERVRRVERLLRQMRSGVFDLQEELKYCSPLGPMLQSLRRTRKSRKGATVGTQTIRRLEAAGVRSISALERLSLSDLMGLNIRRSLAEQIRVYVKRRLS